MWPENLATGCLYSIGSKLLAATHHCLSLFFSTAVLYGVPTVTPVDFPRPAFVRISTVLRV